MPLNLTAVALEKLVPVIVTVVPTDADVGEKDEIVGVATVIVKFPLLVPVPFEVVTEIGPLVAPEGTVAVILVALLTV